MAGLRDELPAITGGVQRQLEYPKGGTVAQLAVGSHGRNGCVIGAAGPDDEFAYAICLVKYAGGSLGGKAFINMVMAIQNKVSLGGIEQLK